MATDRRLTLPLAARIFLLAASLVVLVAGVAIAITWQQGQRVAARESAQALDTSVAVQREFEQRRLEQLQFMVQQLAADAHFVAYVADARHLALGLAPEADAGIDHSGIGSRSVHDLLNERKESYGFDLGIVLDEEAVVLARSDQTEFFADDLREDALVGSAWESLRPYAGYWRLEQTLYQAAILPLQQGRDLVGFVLLALRVDDVFARRIAAVSGAEIAYVLPDAEGARLVAASLHEIGASALARQLGTGFELAAEGTRQTLELDDEQWLLQTDAVADSTAPELGTILSLASTSQRAAGYRFVLNQVLVGAIAALLLALLLSYLLSKGVLRPLRKLAEATESAAAGDYAAEVALSGRDELARLSRAIDGLLASLREKRDIEAYLGDLTRALPEPTGESIEAERALAPPRRQPLLFLALRVPDDADPAQSSAQPSWAAAFGAIESLHAVAVDWSDRHLLLAYDTLPTALHDLRLLRARLGATTGTWAVHRAPADCVEVRVAGRIQTRLRAAPAALLDRLLAAAPNEAIALGPTAAQECRDLLGANAVRILRADNGQPLLVLDPALLERLPSLSRVQGVDSVPGADGLQPGRVLGQRYQVLSQLGSGGMGVVYKVRDRDLDEIVALKLLRPGALIDASQLQRLKDELRLARKITHPNVVRTFDYVEIDGLPCISMEYVRGMTLRFLLESSGRVPLSAGLRIARQIAAGLDAAHRVGVLHRDLKPENVILEASGNAKLMDFGIARPIQRQGAGQTVAGTFVGTPQYCAPEQLAGEPVGAAGDLYAFGVVLCELFGGRLPHAGNNTMELYVAKMQQPPAPPSSYGVSLPPGLENLILACLELSPGRRPGNAGIVLDALGQVRI